MSYSASSAARISNPALTDRREPSLLEKNERALYGVLAITAGLLAWEGLGRSGLIAPVLISSPTKIVEALYGLVASGAMAKHIMVTAQEFAVGLSIALVVGIPLALLAGWYSRLGWVLGPLVSAIYATPTIALFPLIIVVVGIGLWDKVILIFLSAFLQLFVSITVGVRALDRRWVRVARSMNASQGHILRTIVLPGSVPFIVLGIRLAIARSVVNVVTGELLASKAGLGFIIAYYGNNFRISEVFAAILCTVTVGVTLNQMMMLVEKRFEHWRPSVGSR